MLVFNYPDDRTLLNDMTPGFQTIYKYLISKEHSVLWCNTL